MSSKAVIDWKEELYSVKTGKLVMIKVMAKVTEWGGKALDSRYEWFAVTHGLKTVILNQYGQIKDGKKLVDYVENAFEEEGEEEEEKPAPAKAAKKAQDKSDIAKVLSKVNENVQGLAKSMVTALAEVSDRISKLEIRINSFIGTIDASVDGVIIQHESLSTNIAKISRDIDSLKSILTAFGENGVSVSPSAAEGILSQVASPMKFFTAENQDN